MNVICGSCKIGFVPEDNVHITRCGHIFHRDCLFNWLIGTNTCPECYDVCATSDVHRLYLSLTSESPEEEALKNLNLEIAIANKTYAEQDAMISELRQQVFNTLVEQRNLEANIAKLRTEYSQEKLQQIQHLKQEIEQRKGVQKKLIELASWDSVQKVLTGSQADVEEILKSVKSPLFLARMIVLLRREIKEAQDKGKAFRIALRESQEANKKLVSENREHLGKIEILKGKNFNLWDNLLMSRIPIDVEWSENRETMQTGQPRNSRDNKKN